MIEKEKFSAHVFFTMPRKIQITISRQTLRWTVNIFWFFYGVPTYLVSQLKLERLYPNIHQTKFLEICIFLALFTENLVHLHLKFIAQCLIYQKRTFIVWSNLNNGGKLCHFSEGDCCSDIARTTLKSLGHLTVVSSIQFTGITHSSSFFPSIHTALAQLCISEEKVNNNFEQGLPIQAIQCSSLIQQSICISKPKRDTILNILSKGLTKRLAINGALRKHILLVKL